MPAITQDVTLLHRLQKDAEPVPVEFHPGDQVSIIREWADHYLIRDGSGRVFNIAKSFINPAE